MTESQLNGRNKGQVVEFAMKLQEKLEEATAGALTASGLERKVLALQREVIYVKDNALQRKQEFEHNVATIKANTEIKLKELELEYTNNDSLEAKELNELFKSLEEKATKAKKDLTFGLKEAETNSNEALIKIEENISKITNDSEEKFRKLEETLIEKKSEILNETIKLNKNHSRDIEAIKYEHKIALRDEDIELVNLIAEKKDLAVLPNAQFKKLSEFKEIKEDELAKTIKSAEDKAKSSVHAIEGSKFNSLKSNSENTIKLLENDKLHLSETNINLNNRITQLEAQVQNIPTAIKNAVEAAKTVVTTNVDAGKK